MAQDILKDLKNKLISIKRINYKKRKILNFIIVCLIILMFPSFLRILFPYMDYTFIVSLIFAVFYWNIAKEK